MRRTLVVTAVAVLVGGGAGVAVAGVLGAQPRDVPLGPAVVVDLSHVPAAAVTSSPSVSPTLAPTDEDGSSHGGRGGGSDDPLQVPELQPSTLDGHGGSSGGGGGGGSHG